MTTGFQTPVTRPPPPKYCEAVHFPVNANSSTNFKASEPNVSEENKYDNIYQTLPEINKYVDPHDPQNTCPSDIVYLYQPGHHYNNVGADLYRKFKYIYRFKKGIKGQSVIVLEAIPETLASSQESMGVKTYAELEVVESGSQPGSSMCGVNAINGGERVGVINRCMETQSNSKAMPLPINGLVQSDRLIVDTLLNDSSGEHWNNVANFPPPDPPDFTVENGEISPVMSQVDVDLESLTQALETDEKSVHSGDNSGENTPLLQNQCAQYPHNVNENKSSETQSQRKCENDHDYADSGYSDTHRVEFKEHVTDHSTEHVLDTVIYSEPEYSSSDVSIKCSGDTLSNALDKYQRTLKRTNNGTDHTVYELSPSDSFYKSADNMNTVGKRNSIASGDGICRISQSSSSLIDGQRSRHSLNRDTSVSFKKPLVVGPSDDSTCRMELQPSDAQAEMADAEPLVTVNAKPKTEVIPSQMVLEDTRTYYRRKAADRGTLYCAAGGITVVAIIVFLLIYFS